VGADPTLRAYAAFLLARLLGGRDRTRALALATPAEALATAAGNDALAALALDAAGTLHRAAGDVVALRACYDRALGRVGSPSGRLVRLIVAQNYAASLAQHGEAREALARLKVAAEAAATLPMPHLVAIARANLGTASLAAGRMAEAVPLLEGSLAEARRVGDRASAYKHASELALATAVLGDGVRAAALLDAVEPPPDALADHALRRGWAAVARGEIDLAWSHLASAVALASDPAEVELLALGLAHRLGDAHRVRQLGPRVTLRPALVAAWAAGETPDPPDGMAPDAWMIGAVRR
jgi:hypothetical protein